MPTAQIILSVLALVSMLGYWIIAFIILYHLTRFGVGVQPKRFAAVFLFGSIILFAIALISFASINFDSINL
jgi:hypothetical protein